jgi:hypothetical protein
MNLVPVRVEHAHGEGARVRNHCEESGAPYYGLPQLGNAANPGILRYPSRSDTFASRITGNGGGSIETEHIVWEIMKSFEEEGLRFVSSKEIDDARQP